MTQNCSRTIHYLNKIKKIQYRKEVKNKYIQGVKKVKMNKASINGSMLLHYVDIKHLNLMQNRTKKNAIVK